MIELVISFYDTDVKNSIIIIFDVYLLQFINLDANKTGAVKRRNPNKK